jgi:hypothetical protein
MAYISYSSEPSLSIHRVAFDAEKLVYIARANHEFSYKRGRSDIGYIGTTKDGVWRIAASAADRGEMLLEMHGVRSLDFHVVTCTPIPGLKSWRKLERALLIRFCERFGELPKANKIGHGMHWTNERDYFSVDRLDTVLDG